MAAPATVGEPTELSEKYETPLGLAHTTMQALKDRIKLHYDLASDYYLSLWGEHIHHGYWPTDESKAQESKEDAQVNLITLLLETAQVAPEGSGGTRVLDVGCGVGGTSRYLALQHGCAVTGITISSKQVQIATQLSKAKAAATAASSEPKKGEEVVEEEGKGQQQQQQQQQPATAAGATAPAATTTTPDASASASAPDDGFVRLGSRGGKVKFLELDAEKMAEFFPAGDDAAAGSNSGGSDAGFDLVWISEALSHFPNKPLFFRNAARVLRPGGKLVLADWFKAEGLGEEQFAADIKPIEDGMLLPPLCTQADYVRHAADAGLRTFAGPRDISRDVAKTWDISWRLVQNPNLWAFAFSQGRDGIAFLQAFRAMRRGYANGTFRYAVMCFQK